LNAPVTTNLTVVDPLGAIRRLPNGRWAAVFAPGRLLIAETREQAMGMYMFEVLERTIGSKIPDEKFPIFDFAEQPKKGGAA
jgi:hypothetical protein